MADTSTIASLATAGGTLVLAVATFSSVRAGNRASRTSERALLASLRPVLFPSRREDEVQKIRWGDGHWARLPGGRATVEVVNDVVYLAASLRNVGAGIAVLHSWKVMPIATTGGLTEDPYLAADEGRAWRPAMREPQRPDPDDFHAQQRDLYVPAGDISFWQAAIREPDHPGRDDVLEAIEAREPIAADLLYGDHEGGQRTISRFSLVPVGDGDDAAWLCTVVRHWNLDRSQPR